MKGYTSFNRNRTEGNMGGVVTYTLDNDSPYALKLSEGKEDNEYIVTRHSQFCKPINVINVYGDNESRTSVEIIDRKWEELLKEVSKVEARKEHLNIVDDQNKSVSVSFRKIYV